MNGHSDLSAICRRAFRLVTASAIGIDSVTLNEERSEPRRARCGSAAMDRIIIDETDEGARRREGLLQRFDRSRHLRHARSPWPALRRSDLCASTTNRCQSPTLRPATVPLRQMALRIGMTHSCLAPAYENSPPRTSLLSLQFLDSGSLPALGHVRDALLCREAKRSENHSDFTVRPPYQSRF